ncbi:alpha-L-fucosidase-domain-containing protein [Chlamydoabsidia padenii]|nr:alpha-L-fucosidase-domain-containing protein [Chlamydoabsidia padenii]
MTCPELTSSNRFQIGNVPFQLIPQDHPHNEATASGQVITLPKQPLGALYLLVAVNHGPVTSTHLAITYQDGSISSTIIDVPDWQISQPKDIQRLDHVSCQTNRAGVNGTLFLVPLFVDPAKTVSHLTLPYTYPVGSFAPTLHTLAITAYPAQGVHVISLSPTEHGSEFEYVRVRLHNTSPYFLSQLKVSIAPDDDDGEKENNVFYTVHDGMMHRLGPGQIAVVRVPIDRRSSSSSNETQFRSCLVTVTSKSWYGVQTTLTQEKLQLELSERGDYHQDERSLERHQAPQWLREAKFGIFIHWGVYSVPSWAKVGQFYSEWYWWQLMQKNSPTYYHHRHTFGEHFEYDDFIDLWDTSAFDPYQWLDLVDKAHAKYYVFTTKHHDGVALFDTKVSQRSSVHFKPQRDFVKELMDVSKTSYPHLKRGLYFSLPEWYHPQYRDDWLGWSGPPRNAYNSSIVPYTGSPPIDDFVNELQVPQFKELIDNFEPDIIWCDIGGINNSTVWQADYFNKAQEQKRQVAVNDRCGNGISDFNTIEYRGVSNIPHRFWEATRGIDPYSFGYNHETFPNQYASTTSLIHELIQVVARGGNFLLNIGPDGQGNVPEPMRQRLIEMGEWLAQARQSIFDADPYWVTIQDTGTPGQTLLFTSHRLGSSFYIFCLERPVTGRIIVRAPVPVQSHTLIRLMGDPLHETLDWKIWDNGRLIIEVPEHIIDIGKHAWVFELRN